jgi:hypothetical protein
MTDNLRISTIRTPLGGTAITDLNFLPSEWVCAFVVFIRLLFVS